MIAFVLTVTSISTDPLHSIPSAKLTTGNVSINFRHQLLLNPQTLTISQTTNLQSIKINQANIAKSLNPFLLINRKNLNLHLFNSRFDKFAAPILASVSGYNYTMENREYTGRTQISNNYTDVPYNNVKISNCSFSNGLSEPGKLGGGLYISSAIKIEIEYSNFTSNQGGALYIEPASSQDPVDMSVTLLYCNFVNNSGTDGSSIKIKTVNSVSIRRCLFVGDKLVASGTSILSRISLESVYYSIIRECAFNEFITGNVNYGYDISFTANNQYAPDNVAHYVTDGCFSTMPNTIAAHAYMSESYDGKSTSLSIQNCITELSQDNLYRKVGEGNVYEQNVIYNHTNEDGWCVVPSDPIPDESSSEDSYYWSEPESSISEESSTDPGNHQENGNVTAIAVGSTIGVIFLIIIIVLIVWCLRTDKRTAFQNNEIDDANVDGYNVPV